MKSEHRLNTPMLFYMHVKGIPCIAKVTYYLEKDADPFAHTDWDYYGYTEIEYDLFTRKGRPANLLKKFITTEEDDLIAQVSSYVKNVKEHWYD